MSKRGDNIYRRKDGRWEGRYMKTSFTGSSKFGYVYGKTYKEAKEKLRSISNSLVPIIQEPIVSSNPNTSDYFKSVALEWLSFIDTQIKQSSYVKYYNIIHIHLIPRFGNYIITDITREDVNQFCSELLLGNSFHQALSPKSVTDIISVIKSIFDYAERIKRYAIITLNGISVKQTQKKLRILSISEQQRLSEYLLDNFDLCNFGILMCLYTGLRIGEVCALKWADILFDERALYVHQTMQRLQVKNDDITKTENDLIS